MNLNDEWSLSEKPTCSECNDEIHSTRDSCMSVFICKGCQKERWDCIRKSHIGPQGDFIMDSIFSVYKREGNRHLLIEHTELNEEAEVLTIYPVDEKAIGFLIGLKGVSVISLIDLTGFKVIFAE